MMPKREKHAPKMDAHFSHSKLQEKYTPVLEAMQEGCQNYKILKHMIEKGKITSMDAFFDYHITRLSGRIFDLKNKYGVDIITTMKTVKSEDGTTTFAEYTLGGDADAGI